MSGAEDKARENDFAIWLRASLETPEIVFMTMERVGETMNLRRFTAVRDYDAGFEAGRLAALDEAAKVAREFPAEILHFYERPGSPPGNQLRPSTFADVAAFIEALKERK